MNRRLCASLVALAACSSCRKGSPPPDPGPAEAPSALPSPSAPPTSEVVRHCSGPSTEPFLLASTGRDATVTAPRAASDGGKRPSAPRDQPEGELPGPSEPSDDLLPYATEVGEGTTFAGGFAVGAIHTDRGSPALALVRLGLSGEGASLLSLGRATGDIEPPRVVGSGSSVYFGVLEPQPNGRALRIGKVEGTSVTWGATLAAREGESQGFDLAVDDKKLLAAWDDERPEGAGIQAAALDLATLAPAPARRLTPADRDADTPRLLARRGGFWLAYIARKDAPAAEGGPYVAEDIGYRWIEVMPLDANGAPAARPRSVSAADGHVMLFDLAPAPDDGALLVWRDEDTSTGSGGGQIFKAAIHLSEVQPPVLLLDSEVGAGAPRLLGPWLAVTDASDVTRLAPLRPTGEVAGDWAAEPAIGAAEPLAASGGTLLLARPAGRDMKLEVVTCRARSEEAGAAAPLR